MENLRRFNTVGSVRKPSSVQAWARLRITDAAHAFAAADSESVTRDVLRRVTDRVGHEAESLQVMPNLGVFVVSADPEFLRELERQPEIASVKPTNEPDLTLIRPVKSKEISPRSKSRSPAKSGSRKKSRSRKK